MRLCLPGLTRARRDAPTPICTPQANPSKNV